MVILTNPFRNCRHCLHEVTVLLVDSRKNQRLNPPYITALFAVNIFWFRLCCAMKFRFKFQKLLDIEKFKEEEISKELKTAQKKTP